MMSKADLMTFDSRDALQEHFVVLGRTCHTVSIFLLWLHYCAAS